MILNCRYLFRSLVLFLFFVGLISCNKETNSDFAALAKVALREVGHKLLLSNNDSTSLVQPVLALDASKYKLSFQKPLGIHPDSLVTFVRRSFQKAEIPPFYLTEVLRCEDEQVSYSYEMNEDVEKGIIPCGGRELPVGCYTITVHFTQLPEPEESNLGWLFVIAPLLLLTVVLVFYKRKAIKNGPVVDTNFSALGRFKFYPEQNKLVKEATEINLSKKECELLAIFIAQPNQIIKRDELTKKVWEDNGVIVGRSLDTYISKLRKKLQDDTTIQLVNIHGVGYKLEIE